MTKENSFFDVSVIGGGAAGFFCAINIKKNNPDLNVVILEKTDKLLSKVKVSGGGRCNVTHNCSKNDLLLQNYPRGIDALKSIFEQFSVADTILWFENEGVTLKTEPDGRMFPNSNSSQTIIDCFLRLCSKFNIKIIQKCNVRSIKSNDSQLQIISDDLVIYSNKVVISTGGYSNPESYQWLKSLGILIENPVPSLFTFNDKNLVYKHLAGVSVQNACIKIHNTDFEYSGPVLFTHWGLSGPAIIKLSAWAAQYLAAKNYVFTIEINFLNSISYEKTKDELLIFQNKNNKKNIIANPLFEIPKRLWEMFCMQSMIAPERSWAEFGKKNREQLACLLTKNTFEIKGKTTFKEEFVTCGGVLFDQLNPENLALKSNEKIFFAGEVLHTDGITGGFNFQAAWSTAWVVAKEIAKKK